MLPSALTPPDNARSLSPFEHRRERREADMRDGVRSAPAFSGQKPATIHAPCFEARARGFKCAARSLKWQRERAARTRIGRCERASRPGQARNAPHDRSAARSSRLAAGWSGRLGRVGMWGRSVRASRRAGQCEVSPFEHLPAWRAEYDASHAATPAFQGQRFADACHCAARRPYRLWLRHSLALATAPLSLPKSRRPRRKPWGRRDGGAGRFGVSREGGGAPAISDWLRLSLTVRLT